MTTLSVFLFGLVLCGVVYLRLSPSTKREVHRLGAEGAVILLVLGTVLSGFFALIDFIFERGPVK